MTQQQELYGRNDHIMERQVDGDVFLIDDRRGRIHALDQMGSGIWRLLEQPQPVHDIVAVFIAAFPGRKPKELRRMVERFMSQLEQDGLAVRLP
jgi:hypothetical protein